MIRRGALVVAMAAAVAASSLSAATSQPRLSIPQNAVKGGVTVTVIGSSWPCRAPVRIRAFVAGVSPYPAIAVGGVRPSAAREFRLSWKTRRVVDSLAWRVEARQRCGGRTYIAADSLVLNAVRPPR